MDRPDTPGSAMLDAHAHAVHGSNSGDRLVSIEAGGTKFNVGVGNSAGILTDQAQFRTTTPGETLDSVAGWIQADVRKRGPVAAIGLASFGPVAIDPGPNRKSHRSGQSVA